MTGRRRGSFRGRLLVALAGVSTAGTAVVVVVVLGLTRATAQRAALDELVDKAGVLKEVDQTRLQGNLLQIRRLLDVERVGLLVISPTGSLEPRRAERGDGSTASTSRARSEVVPLPAGLEPGDLDLEALRSGSLQSGSRGSLVYVAQPLEPTENGAVPVAVAATTVSAAPLGRLGPYLLIGVVVSLAFAAIVATLLSRRLTRPISAMELAARSIARGDFTTRVGEHDDADDELASLARAMDGMARELEDARGRERAFLLNISHDLRTPLTSIRGYAEAIAEGAVDGAASRERAAQVILGESKRLERLVADLLDLARLDARQFSLDPQVIDVSAAVAGVAEGFRPAAAEAGLRVEIDVPPSAPALADPERLGQVVANLIENAWKYAETTVSVSVRTFETKVEIAVADDGPGIEPDDMPRIFERLYTSRDAPGRKVGTGLGLAIVRELVVAMGGRVRATDAPGGGARMVVHLPRPAGLRRTTRSDGGRRGASP